MALQLKQYRKNLSKQSDENLFLLPWGGVVLRNCNELGDLLSFKCVASYREHNTPMWLVLSLVLFRENVRHLSNFTPCISQFNYRMNFSQSFLVKVVQAWSACQECR